MARRLYALRYTDTKQPVYFDDIGTKLRISGMILQGMGSTVYLYSPNAVITPENTNHAMRVRPSLEEWCELLRLSDDPVYFEETADHQIKAIHRKQLRAVPGSVQWKVWYRDGLQCMYCGVTKVPLTVDHYVPLQHGGANEMENYLTSCRPCNKAKGDKLPEEWCSERGYDHDTIMDYLKGEIPIFFMTHLN